MKKLFVLTGCIFFFTFCEAQYNVLLNLNGTVNGANPYGSLTLSGNVMYGMTSDGGANNDGCIFSINTDGSGYKDLFDFDGKNGQTPYGSLTLSGGVLYGMTNQGGFYYGCVFSIHTNGSGYKNLLNFGTDSIYTGSPNGSLTLSGKKLFGTATGKNIGPGSTFSIDTNGTNYKDLSDGGAPSGDLILSGNFLYGVTNMGGKHNDGSVFSMDTNGSDYKDILDFNDTNGANPYGSLTLSGNVLYGTTYGGGAHGYGCIFSVHTDGSGYKDMLDFSDTNGANPKCNTLILSGNTLCGMTYYGGAYGKGCIFSINTDGSNYKDLHDFNLTNGGFPYGHLTLSGNTFYGMTTSGGSYNKGVIFSFTDADLGVNNTNILHAHVSVYPNPSNGLYIVSLRHAELVSASQPIVEIYNALGEKVLSEALKQVQGDNVINLSNQPNGIYLYRIMSENGNLVGEGKLVIQR